MENICDLIVAKRKERGLTQAELGAMLGISGNAVCPMEQIDDSTPIITRKIDRSFHFLTPHILHLPIRKIP